VVFMVSGYITNKGANIAIDRLFESAPTYSQIAQVQYGACVYAPALTDTKVYFPIPIDATNVDVIDDCEAADWTAETDGDTPTLNADAGYHLEGSNGLNLLATYSAGSAGFYKTFADFDVTDNYFCIPVRIDDLSLITAGASAVTIDLGTGGFTDYNRYTINKNLLQVGWNYLVCDGNNPDTTGGAGATEATINRVKITITNSTDLVAGDIVMDWIQTYPIADTFTTFDASPTYSEANKTSTFRFSLNAVQANSYALREIGVWDNTKTYLYSRDVFTTINKSQYITLTTEQQDKIING
jgi:hypothetical protein